MWKRPRNPADRAIGKPRLLETTLDERSAGALKDITNGDRSLTGRPLFGTKGSADVVKELPDIPSKNTQSSRETTTRKPLEQAPSQGQRPQQQSYERPKIQIPRSSSHHTDDISPPDSPRTTEGGRTSSPNISPVTDAGSVFRDQSSNKPYASRIPLPNASSAGGTAAYISSWREKLAKVEAASNGARTHKWDSFSGELTASDQGRPTQVMPDTFEELHGKHGMATQGLGITTEISANNASSLARKSSFTAKFKNIAKRDVSPMQQVREAWKGQSGRSPIMRPVVDKPLPELRSSSQSSLPTSSAIAASRANPTASTWTVDSVSSLSSASSKELPIRKDSLLPAIQNQSNSSTDISDARNEHMVPPPLRLIPPSDTSSEIVDRTSPLARNPSREALRDTEVTASPQQMTPAKSSPTLRTHVLNENQIRKAFLEMNFENEPASRFSATTYNSTIADQTSPDTPKLSYEEPQALPTPPDSILNRKRPVPVAGVPRGNKTPTRKPTPSSLTSDGVGGLKSLPQSPQNETIDRVTLMEAKLATLNRRKVNLATMINELTNVVQPSSIAYDLASRQEIKKTVDGLEKEAAIVQKDIHETGLQLHRLMKRRDEASYFEPTGLWVRRVTE